MNMSAAFRGRLKRMRQCGRNLHGGTPLATATAPAPEGTPAARAAARPGWIERNHFWLRRLHSLTGIVPIGGFLLFHFYENGAIFYGVGAYDEMATGAR